MIIITVIRIMIITIMMMIMIMIIIKKLQSYTHTPRHTISIVYSIQNL